MKKLLLILGVILMLLTACNKTYGTVTISADRNIYTPAMSSAQGITLTPNFKSDKNYTNLEYHWITEKGSFILAPSVYVKEVKNQGKAVLWGAIADDKVVDIKSTFKIRLEVIDSESQKILANTKLTIESNNNGFYEIKK